MSVKSYLNGKIVISDSLIPPDFGFNAYEFSRMSNEYDIPVNESYIKDSQIGKKTKSNPLKQI